MKVTLITHKANKDGTVTLYLGKGVDRYRLLDLEGKEIEIEATQGEKDIPAYEFDQIIPICRMIEESREKEYERGYHECKEKYEQMEQTSLKGGQDA